MDTYVPVLGEGDNDQDKYGGYPGYLPTYVLPLFVENEKYLHYVRIYTYIYVYPNPVLADSGLYIDRHLGRPSGRPSGVLSVR